MTWESIRTNKPRTCDGCKKPFAAGTKCLRKPSCFNEVPVKLFVHNKKCAELKDLLEKKQKNTVKEERDG